jgi:hypothetical protein
MNCDLALTGTDLAWTATLVGAAVLILVGALLWRRGLRRGGAAMVVLILLGAGALAITPAPRVQAACAANSLTIVQSSTNSGLAPTQAPTMIVGRVTNNGPDETFVTAITVSIASVVPAPGATPGTCDAGDYVLLDSRMPVGEQLAADGGSAVFSGATIGFLDKQSNQDSCKGARIGLHYTSE